MDGNRIDKLREKALLLPLEPGCYLMKDEKGVIIYVGKAKALKNRVVSYFRENAGHTEKTRQMVSCVRDFDFIVTGSEFEALILECSLIKHYRPKYNILLMDDKGYHYIHLTDEPYPRIEAVLQKPQDGGLLIGPYMSAYVVRQTADQVNQVFMLPTCSRKFPQDFKKQRPCLNFYIKRCMGLCQGKLSQAEYRKIIGEAVEYIRSGGVTSVDDLEKEMYAASEALDFERAARLRDQIAAIRRIADKQTVLLGEDRQMDVWGFAQNAALVSCVVLKIRDGRIADKENYTFDGEGDIPAVREEFVYRYYAGREEIPRAVVLDGPVEDMGMLAEFLKLQCGHVSEPVLPQRGERKKLRDMAVLNAEEQLAHKIRRTGREVAALEELQKLLGLPATPVYIEAYDISNWGDTGRVGGMVVFENGRPLKKDYKRFAIRDVAGQDDYASMREVLRRRFTRYLDGDAAFSRLPDLILLDGGRGHVNAVQPVLDELRIDVPLFGMVKDSRHRTRGLTTGREELALPMVRSAFTLVTNIQDEVHRYAIAYQRTLHRKADTASQLKAVKGIGDVKLKKLLARWPTKPKLKSATAQELKDALKIGDETARALLEAIAQL